jgi:hypothetical protein
MVLRFSFRYLAEIVLQWEVKRQQFPSRMAAAAKPFRKLPIMKRILSGVLRRKQGA